MDMQVMLYSTNDYTYAEIVWNKNNKQTTYISR